MSKFDPVQKISHFEICDFGRISYEKTDRIDILRNLTSNISSPTILVQISCTLHQVNTQQKYHKIDKSQNFQKALLTLFLHMVGISGANFS